MKGIKSKPELYRQRQAIVEHPFGTIKRSWGFTYVITKKGMDRASGDVGFMFLAYSLLRIFNILDFEELQKYFLSLRSKIHASKKAIFDHFYDLGLLAATKWILRPFFANDNLTLKLKYV